MELTTGEINGTRQMISDFAKLSVKNLSRRGKRSWLTIIGVVIGITAIVALFSLSQGFEDSITREFDDLGANIVYVLPGSGVEGFFSPEGRLEDSDLDTTRRVIGVEEAGPMVYEAESVARYRGEEQRVPLIGIPTDSSQETIMRANSLEIDRGRNIREGDRFSGVVGHDIAEAEVFEREVGLRTQVEVEGTDVRTSGVFERTGDPEYDGGLFLPIDSAREILDEDDRTDFIVVEVQAGQEPQQVAEQIEQDLRQERNVREGEEDFTVSTADDLLESFLDVLGIVQYGVLGIVSIALFVGGLGIMNTMYMSVSERTKEIGIMKAMGATKRQILSIFLVEAGVLGLIGGAIGIIVGLGLSEVAFYLIRQFVGIPLSPTISLTLIISALGLSFILGVFSGFLPARKAARLEPVEAIRQQ